MKTVYSLLFFLCLTFNCHTSYAAEIKMAVSEMKGDCQILRDQNAMKAGLGTECQKADIVKTGADGQMDVTWNGRLGCRILPSTELALMDTNRESMRVDVKVGNIILNVKSLPKDSTFRVESPTAVAVVRGTQFWGRVENSAPNNPVTTFAVREGKVEILAKSSQRTFYLEPGQALDIPMDASAEPQTRKALDEEMSAMEQASAIKTDM